MHGQQNNKTLHLGHKAHVFSTILRINSDHVTEKH